MNIFRLIKRNYLIKLTLTLSMFSIFITTIIGTILLNRANTIMANEITKDGQYNLEKVKDFVESNLLRKYEEYHYNKYYTAIYPGSNQDVNYLLEKGTSGNSYRIIKMQEELKKSVDENPGIENVTVAYMKDKSTIDSNYYYKSIDDSPNSSFIETLGSTKPFNWFSREYTSNGQKRKVLTYVYQLNNYYRDTMPNSYLFVDVNLDYIKNSILSILGSPNIHFYIIDQNKQLILSNDDDKDQYSMLTRVIDSNSPQRSFFSDKNGNNAILYLSPDSSKTGFTYASIRPMNSFTLSSEHFKRDIMLVCLIVAIIGISLSYLMSKRFYSPIRRIIENIKNLTGINNNSQNENEYLIINDTINSMNNRIRNLQDRVKDKAFLNILSGNYADLEDIFQFETDGIYQVAEIYIHQGRISHFKDVYGKTRLSEKSRLIITEENKAVLVYFPMDSEDIGDQLVEYFKDIGSKAGQELIFSAGIGSVVKLLEEVNISFNHAKYAGKYVFLLDVNSFIKYEDVVQRKPHMLYFEYDNIKNILKSGNVEAINRFFTNYYNDTVEKDISIESVELSLTQIVVILSRILMDSGLDNVVISSSEILNDFKRATFFETVEWLKKLALNIALYIKKDSKDYHISIINELKNYINEHMSEDISLDVLSELASLSSAYISTLFSDVLNISFSEYLTQVRMEKAANLLAKANYSVSEVSTMVGYRNSQYFCKKFRIKFGVSPMQYRNSQINE